ncbi:hypothetical protein M2440_003428 [Methylorubrum extorquens]|nr:hypothetical protein [Methylorubrum extorquens]
MVDVAPFVLSMLVRHRRARRHIAGRDAEEAGLLSVAPGKLVEGCGRAGLSSVVFFSCRGARQTEDARMGIRFDALHRPYDRISRRNARSSRWCDDGDRFERGRQLDRASRRSFLKVSLEVLAEQGYAGGLRAVSVVIYEAPIRLDGVAAHSGQRRGKQRVSAVDARVEDGRPRCRGGGRKQSRCETAHQIQTAFRNEVENVCREVRGTAQFHDRRGRSDQVGDLLPCGEHVDENRLKEFGRLP